MKRIISVFLLFNFLSTSSEISSARAVNCNTGIFMVTGNVGFDGDLNVCGAGSFAGPLKVSNTAASTSCTNGAFTVAGGVSINGNLNVCGTINGAVSYTYADADCSSNISRTVQSKLNDYLIDIKDFGAKGDGATDDSAAIQAAINCVSSAGGGTVFFPSGQYLVNTTLNLTIFAPQPPTAVKFLGTSPVTTHDSACTILANTGGILFDCTGSGQLQFENFHVECKGRNVRNPSTIAFVFQRNSPLEASYNQLSNVSVDMTSIPSANNGYGTVAVYNYSSELFYMNFCKLFADSPLIIASVPLAPTFNSVYSTTATTVEPTTMFYCENCGFYAYTYNAVFQYNPTNFITQKEHRFINCYCRYLGADPSLAGDVGAFAYRVNALTVNCEYSGQLETFTQYFNFQRAQQRTKINCNVGGAIATTLPIIQLSDPGSNLSGPGLWGCEINLWTRGNVAVPLLQCATGTTAAGVYDCDIYVSANEFLDLSNCPAGGNRIHALASSTIPTILQNPSGHGYLLFNQSSTVNFDGNLNLSGTGAYQQSGSFLIGQDTALNNVAVGVGSMGNGTALPNSNVKGSFNTAYGILALKSLTSGSYNTAIGYNTLASNSAGANNVAMGYQAMQNTANSNGNIAVGQLAMQASNNATNNIAIGLQSFMNAAGSSNVAVGRFSMQRSGALNNAVAIGNFAMQNSRANSNAVAAGVNAMQATQAGGAINAVAIGNGVMQNAASVTNTVAIGVGAMASASGTNAVAIGNAAMQKAIAAHNSIAVGINAMRNAGGSNNIAIGPNALISNVSGNNNIAIGNLAASKYSSIESNNIIMANVGVIGDSGQIRIGTTGNQTGCFIAGIRGASTKVDGIGVVIDSSGKLGTLASSKRFKTDIADIEGQQEKMMRLRPVSFSYKTDATQTKQYGLIAEEVHEIYPELVIHQDGEIYTVNYLALIPLLLKQIQELEKQNLEKSCESNAIKAQQIIFEKEITKLRTIVTDLTLNLESVINFLNVNQKS